MLTHNTLDTLRHLKLTGMGDALEQQRAQPETHDLAFEERRKGVVGPVARGQILLPQTGRVVAQLPVHGSCLVACPGPGESA